MPGWFGIVSEQLYGATIHMPHHAIHPLKTHKRFHTCSVITISC